jgi:hypothetical protein
VINSCSACVCDVKDVSTLTILVMGKGGVGKSSTVNSIVGERVASVSAFQVLLLHVLSFWFGFCQSNLCVVLLLDVVLFSLRV